MQQVIKINSKTSPEVIEHLKEFPYYTIRCKLSEILNDRGVRMIELSCLTGIRVATLSEIANMQRTTLNVPHLIVIAKVLRLTDIGELFEITMPPETLVQFLEDRDEIDGHGLLVKQHEEIIQKRGSRE